MVEFEKTPLMGQKEQEFDCDIENLLRRKYFNEEKSAVEGAEELGIGGTTFLHWLRKLGIARRDRWEGSRKALAKKHPQYSSELIYIWRWAKIFGHDSFLTPRQKEVLERLIPDGDNLRLKSAVAKELKISRPDVHIHIINATNRLKTLANFTHVDEEGQTKILRLSFNSYTRLKTIGVTSFSQLRAETSDGLHKKGLGSWLINQIKDQFRDWGWYLSTREERDVWSLIEEAKKDGKWDRLTQVQQNYLERRYPAGKRLLRYREIAEEITKERGIGISRAAVHATVQKAINKLRMLVE